jgi:hypothetical protein
VKHRNEDIINEPYDYWVEWLAEYNEKHETLFIKDIWISHESEKENPERSSIPLTWLLSLGEKLDHNYMSIIRTVNHRPRKLFPEYIQFLKWINENYDKFKLAT